MTINSIFYPIDIPPHTANIQYSLDSKPADSPAQAWKNIEELHTAFRSLYPEARILEISSKSPDSLGVILSAFKPEASLRRSSIGFCGMPVSGIKSICPCLSL